MVSGCCPDIADISEYRRSLHFRIRLCKLETIPDWLPEAMHILQDELPSIEVTVSSQYSPGLADALMKGRLDLAFMRREPRLPDLVFTAVAKEPLVAALFALGVANTRRPEVHKRWMVLLMSAMMTPAIARVFLTLLAPPGADLTGPPPPFVSIPPALVADLFIVVAIVRDWRTIGRPHPIYVYGGLVVLAQQLLTVAFSATPLWMRIATAFEAETSRSVPRSIENPCDH
jgi:DNA-binding transcriptional LysR family regulator